MQSTTDKPFGTLKGERKAARKARAIERERERANVENQSLTEAANWDSFYARGQGGTYRDRNLLRGIFPELVSETAAASPRTHVAPLEPSANDGDGVYDLHLLELGCGVGSAVFPLLRANPRLYVTAMDFSSVAIENLRQHPEFTSARIEPLVGDITDSRSFSSVKDVDFITAFWTLSALDSNGVESALNSLTRLAKSGTLLCIRDYARHDLREQNFFHRQISPLEQTHLSTVFRRGDNTLAAFFDEQALVKSVVNNGWSCVRSETVERSVQNRARELTMKRRWVHAVFCKT